MKTLLRPALTLFIFFSVLTGILYPLVITGIGKWLFPSQITGSLLSRNQQIIGSKLIGQNFTDPGYFWGRPSATVPNPYNASESTGSNYGPLNPDLLIRVTKTIHTLQAYSTSAEQIPVDLVTSSGSGLDPEISPAAALYQVPRIAKVRGLSIATVSELVNQHIQNRQWGILGEKRVNVLELNLALDSLMDSTL